MNYCVILAYTYALISFLTYLQAELMKHEAGGVLGEVKRKQTEATKALDLLKALRKLREARKQEAEVKGDQYNNLYKNMLHSEMLDEWLSGGQVLGN